MGATKPSVQGAVAGRLRKDEEMAGEDSGEMEKSRMGREQAAPWSLFPKTSVTVGAE